MRVWLTGGAGYIGSVTTEALLDAGHTVCVFDNLSRGHRDAVDPRAQWVHGDLQDADGIKQSMASFRPEAVMHFAAFALVGESMRNPELYFRNNVVGGLNLAEAMRKSGVPRIVFSSTCATYGEPERQPMDETLPQRPANPYGESKLLFERILIWYEKIHGISPVFLRYFNACGATEKYGEDHDPETHLIPNILRVALGQEPHVRIFGDDYDTPDGTCIRDYVHVLDLARAHIQALTDDTSGAFNLGTGTGFSVREVVEEARRITGQPIPCTTEPRRPGDPPRLVASAAKAEHQWGWTPVRSDLPSILHDAWAWHQAHPNGYDAGSRESA